MLIEILLTSSVLITGIFILRRLSKGKISMRCRYMLWLLAAARLLIPVSFGNSPFSVMNLCSAIVREYDGAAQIGGTYETKEQGKREQSGFEQAHTTAEPAENGTGETLLFSEKQEETPGGASYAQNTLLEPARKMDEDSLTRSFSMSWALALVWLSGFLAVGGYFLVMRFRFVRFLLEHRRQLPEEALPLSFSERFKKRGIRAYLVKGLPGPCLVGRRIYVGEQVLSDSPSLSHVLAHEYCHAVHGDAFWAFLRCALAAVYWFDPFVWAAVFAARQDCELACDEAAIRLLGENQRFSYGRTLLLLLESGAKGREKCPGMSFMTEGGEHGVKERILVLTKGVKMRGAALAAVITVMVFLVGCAFTGADQEEEEVPQIVGMDADEAEDTLQEAGLAAEEESMDVPERETVIEDENEEFERIKEEAFEEVLNYHGVMEGKDDSELLLDRKLDIQAYYDYFIAKDEEGAENPLENGWYLLFHNEREEVSLYGLYTEEFGFRGVKMRTTPGGDVNTWDIKWCPSHMNQEKDNILVLARDADGLARSFVFKVLEEETSDVEIWRLYTGYQYDTGTVEIHRFEPEQYLAWVKEHLSFEIDQEAGQVTVIYDGDMEVSSLDISPYQDYEVEDVQISMDVVSFILNGKIFGDLVSDGYGDVEMSLAAGLKLKGSDVIWIHDLAPLMIQVIPEEDGSFTLQNPRIDDTYEMHNLGQERSLPSLQSGEDGADTLEDPLINSEADAHHDLLLSFQNPCPDYERVSDGFGIRTHPVTGEVKAHNGVDLAAPEGAGIVAAARGEVYQTGFDAVNGNFVVLWHVDSGQMTYYTHCKTVDVEKGDRVAAGEQIATVGKTGSATGSVLHFAVSYGEKWEEPSWEEL